jgi:hypothetical protein
MSADFSKDFLTKSDLLNPDFAIAEDKEIAPQEITMPTNVGKKSDFKSHYRFLG